MTLNNIKTKVADLNFKHTLLAIGFIFMISSCAMEAGTHGTVKAYCYTINKYKLHDAVNTVIANSTAIQKDSVYDYYNDDTTYVTINCRVKEFKFRYVFRFSGDRLHWDTSKVSSISIAWINATQKKVKNDWVYLKTSEESKSNEPYLKIFEYYLINKIDRVLGQKHMVCE
ncbi:MAG: hypothetical protein H7331_05945 [Bacteroidia bacterium]|nr:hypothetical protein [Bacteroidia bacterium]